MMHEFKNAYARRVATLHVISRVWKTFAATLAEVLDSSMTSIYLMSETSALNVHTNPNAKHRENENTQSHGN